MINRFSRQRLRNQFVPTSVQEYSMVPAAMQQQHAQQSAALGAMNLKWNALPGEDANLALQTANTFNDKLNQSVSDLRSSGITPDSSNVIRDLSTDYSNAISGEMAAVTDRYNTVQQQLTDYEEAAGKAGKDRYWIDNHRKEFMDRVGKTPIDYKGKGDYNRISRLEYSAPVDDHKRLMDMAGEVVKEGMLSYLREVTPEEARVLGSEYATMYVEGKIYAVKPDEVSRVLAHEVQSNPELNKYWQDYQMFYPDANVGLGEGEQSWVNADGTVNEDTMIGRAFNSALTAKSWVDQNENYVTGVSGGNGSGTTNSVKPQGSTVTYAGVSPTGNNSVIAIHDNVRAEQDQQLSDLTETFNQNLDAIKNIDPTASGQLTDAKFSDAYMTAAASSKSKDRNSIELTLLEQAKNVTKDPKAQKMWVESVMLNHDKVTLNADIEETTRQFNDYFTKTFSEDEQAVVTQYKSAISSAISTNFTVSDVYTPIDEARKLKGLPPLTNLQRESMSRSLTNSIMNPKWFQGDKGMSDINSDEVEEEFMKIIGEYAQLTNEDLKLLQENGNGWMVDTGFVGAVEDVAEVAERSWESLFDSKVGKSALSKLGDLPVQGYKLTYDKNANRQVGVRTATREADIIATTSDKSNQMLTNNQMLNNYLDDYASENSLGSEWVIKNANIEAIGIPSTSTESPHSTAVIEVAFSDKEGNGVTKMIGINLSDNYGLYAENHPDIVKVVANNVFNNPDVNASERIGAGKAYATVVLNMSESHILSQTLKIKESKENEIGSEIKSKYTTGDGQTHDVVFRVVKNAVGSTGTQISPYSIDGKTVFDSSNIQLDMTSDAILGFIGELSYGAETSNVDILSRLGIK